MRQFHADPISKHSDCMALHPTAGGTREALFQSDLVDVFQMATRAIISCAIKRGTIHPDSHAGDATMAPEVGAEIVFWITDQSER
jgi:hypothetical protein